MSAYGEFVRTANAAPQLRFERLLPGPIERVWAYLTEPELRAQWFAGGPMELKPGGHAELHFHHARITTPDDPPPAKYRQFNEEVRSPSRVIDARPPHLLVIAFGGGEVRFELAPVGDKVRMTLTHTKVDKRDDLVQFAGGWHSHLNLLDAKLAGATPPPFWAPLAKIEADYAARLKEI
jgi:uncharacterized protein YndB with AHSA1/START domain